MLTSIKRFFEERIAAPNEADPEHALHLATAMLLLEVSQADFGVHDAELEAVAAGLQRCFGLSESEVREVVSLAREEQQNSHSIHEFLRLLNEHFEMEARLRVVEDLWRVAYADGVLDKYEEYHIRKIAELLYVPHAGFIRAKHRVLEELGAGGQ
jgi:uncharacterized tellurite resistance protein B-like protein